METSSTQLVMIQPQPRIDAARVARAGTLARRFPRERQTEFVLKMCERHPYAVDYLEQAPILVIAVAQQAARNNVTCTQVDKPGTPPLYGRQCEGALEDWRRLCELGWPLPKLLAHFKIAPQFRALLPDACQANAWQPVIIMSRHVPGVELAHAIPPHHTGQRFWIKAQVEWYRRMLERNRAIAQQGLGHPLAYITWAAVAFGWKSTGTRYMAASGAAADIADFAIARGVGFNTAWSAFNAADHCAHWHQALNLREAAEREQAERARPDPEIDYAPFPDVFTGADGYRVVALRTRKALLEEGQAMKHCVVDYHAEVVMGVSRIFSVQRPDGYQVCTIQLTHGPTSASPFNVDGMTATQVMENRPGVWRPVQAQGRRANYKDPRPPQPDEARDVVQSFLEAYCPGWPKR